MPPKIFKKKVFGSTFGTKPVVPSSSSLFGSKTLQKSSSIKESIVFELTPEYKEKICLESRLTQRGYTIPKSIIDTRDDDVLKKELTMIPFTNNTFGGASAEETKFYVFRETENSIIIPRFYGIDRYGNPAKNEIPAGTAIDCNFSKTLRDYQVPVVQKYLDHIQSGVGNGGILEVPCAFGKCLSKDTKILMYDGLIKLVQDIKVGDVLMGDDSTPRNVLSLARGRETMYKVQTAKGDSYTVNESHILSLKYGSLSKKGQIVDISVMDYLNLPKYYHEREGLLYGYRVPISFPEKQLEIDPYMVGYWLGDGSSYGTKISCQDSTVLYYFAKNLQKYKLSLIYQGQYDYEICANAHIVPSRCGNHKKDNNVFLNMLKIQNLLNNKHIPLIFKCNSRENQLKLLAGLIDSDGHLLKNGGFEITQKNETLMDDVIYLARSLGFSCYKCVKNTTHTVPAFRKDEKKQGTAFRICINGKGIEEIPVLIPRKKSPLRRQIKDVLNYRITLKKLPEDDYYGFTIDGNRRFVLGDFTVTHNTVMAINMLSVLKKKTLILVHKEFLMNQWIERIAEFLPNARVGKIQADVFDIKDKDIVIGMIQTMYRKDFIGEFVLDSFGLTIIDEVHRIGSEEFSKTLLKVSTQYMLGISATVERKDRLTRILYMFIGPKIYSSQREGTDTVLVRALKFTTNDAEFNETKYDFRGNPQFSTMISKICEYPPRCRFILGILKDLIQENDEAQIIVLCHNICLLTFLFKAIELDKFATCGYYKGGMKKEALKSSEDKQIVLGSYAMASEGLDIPSLATLVLATPKTDIIQCVGRILRVKRANPLIIDIVDTHDIFRNQWTKRRTYYRKCNYRMVEGTSISNCEPIKCRKGGKQTGETDEKDDDSIEDEEDTKKGGVCMISLKDWDE